MSTSLIVKNMVCDRCRLAVADVLNRLELPAVSVDLGEIVLARSDLTERQRDVLSQELAALGFEIVDDRRSRLIEKMKRRIIELVRRNSEFDRTKLSEYLESNLHYDFGYLGNLFSAVEGISVGQYFIRQRVERVKELLVYDEMGLTEIAAATGYSNPSHLSGQFKKVTGMTPGHFRKIRGAKLRRPLDAPP